MTPCRFAERIAVSSPEIPTMCCWLYAEGKWDAGTRKVGELERFSGLRDAAASTAGGDVCMETDATLGEVTEK